VTTIAIPELSLVVLIGVSGSGKSTFAARHFLPTEVLSSDRFRGLVGDDENDQGVSREAFDALHAVAGIRLHLGRLTVVDATNVQSDARAPLVRLAREHHVLPVAIVLDVTEELAHERNASRPERTFGRHVVRRQRNLLRRSLGRLSKEGFRRVAVLRGAAEIETAQIVREPAWSDKRSLHGPFDMVGDVHGCHGELVELLGALGYSPDADGCFRHHDGRTAVFLGDLVDRGPSTPSVLRTVMAMVEAGTAICVPGNHEQKLLRALRGSNVRLSYGLAESMEQLRAEPDAFRQQVQTFLDGLISHYVLDDGKLVVAHAGMPEGMQGRASGAVRAFALYGDTSGETDEFGLPVRYPWAEDYRGSAMVVYGHTPTPEAEWVNGTICIDTGCVFGGALTALRYPERELVSVPALRTYYEPVKPFPEPAAPPVEADGQRPATLLDIEDVSGSRGIETRLHGRLTIPEERAAAALEAMSRFAVDPRWLIYLPPTMAPTATSQRPTLLEHPAEAFDDFRRAGIPTVLCEEKHMGSRAIALICRTDDVAADRFGPRRRGAVITRTGRPFFSDAGMGAAFLDALARAIGGADLWQELGTEWLAIDGEVLPWSLKADGLLRSQYASVGAAARAASAASVRVLEAAAARGIAVASLLESEQRRHRDAQAFVDAYRPYCWPVGSLADVRFAPFQILAGEGATYLAREHAWHMDVAARLADAAPSFVAGTRHIPVDVTDQTSIDEGTVWWEAITADGEGMVVKPSPPIVRSGHRPVQPGIKVRGPEYLRIIYGPEYREPENLDRLRRRALGRKRSLALREFALGVEALERFVRREPLFRVHECVFGVLALESEPVDPRL
jgi:protein phosphatase